MTTVVTGASGHLGGILARVLLDAGREVRALDVRFGPSLEGLAVERVRTDVLDPASVREALRGAEIVYHLAAIISVTGDPNGRVWATNVRGVRNVAEAALDEGVRRFVHCSSVHAYDLARVRGVLNESAPRAESRRLPAYDRSKAAGEAALRELVGRGLDAVVVNPTGIIGPYDFGPSRMGRVFLALRDRTVPALVDGGFDWVDVRDVVTGMRAAEARGTTGENYLLAGHHATLRRLAELAEAVTGVPAPRLTVPMELARLWGPLGTWLGRRTGSPLVFTGESLHALRHHPPMSRAKAEQELGYSARELEETVRDVYAWFEQAKGSDGVS